MNTVHLERMEELVREGHFFVMLRGDRHVGEVIHYDIEGGEAFAVVDRLKPYGSVKLEITPASSDAMCYFPDHTHDEREVMVVVGGSLQPVIAGQRRRKMGPGDITIFEPSVKHGAEVFEHTIAQLTIMPMGSSDADE